MARNWWSNGKRSNCAMVAQMAFLVLAPGTGKTQHCPQWPMELQRVAKSIPCGPISEFYSRPGPIGAPFAYGILPGRPDESAAFWCMSPGKERPYVLIVLEREKVIGMIREDNEPGGLGVSSEREMPLSEFRYVADPKRLGPPAERTQFAPLSSTYDGVTRLYYRLGDEWLVKVTH